MSSRWLCSSRRRDGGLGDGQLLSQVIEASDIVHAALTHHADKLRVHLQTKPLQDQNILLRSVEEAFKLFKKALLFLIKITLTKLFNILELDANTALDLWGYLCSNFV